MRQPNLAVEELETRVITQEKATTELTTTDGRGTGQEHIEPEDNW